MSWTRLGPDERILPNDIITTFGTGADRPEILEQVAKGYAYGNKFASYSDFDCGLWTGVECKHALGASHYIYTVAKVIQLLKNIACKRSPICVMRKDMVYRPRRIPMNPYFSKPLPLP